MREQKAVQFDTDALAPREWHAVTLAPTAGGLSIFVQDITATKAHVEQLERQVSERTAALQGLVSDLEAFSYTLVHDLRAPLRSISSFAELLAVDHTGPLDDEGRGYLARIRKAAARMDRLITAIMNYSQLARQKPELRPVDLHQLVQEIMESDPGFQHEKADIGIVGVLPFVRGNESLLSQCFVNLLHNAIKFVAPGVKPRIRISAQVEGDIARVDVTDNGIGIAPDAAERIFEPFRRHRHRTRDRAQGRRLHGGPGRHRAGRRSGQPLLDRTETRRPARRLGPAPAPRRSDRLISRRCRAESMTRHL
jgi:signal transduction histidine kinase